MSLQSAVVFEGQGRSHDMPILSGHFWTFFSKSLGGSKARCQWGLESELLRGT